ncbi:MAG: DUF6531 domain-containing protein [Bacteroidia bacterium]
MIVILNINKKILINRKTPFYLLFGILSLLGSPYFAQNLEFPIQSNNTSGLYINACIPTFLGQCQMTTINFQHKLVAFETVCDPGNPINEEWFKVYLPSDNGTQTWGYMAKASYYMAADCFSPYITASSSTGYADVYIAAGNLTKAIVNGGTAKIYNNSKFAIYGNASISGSLWYQIYLPNNVVDPNSGTALQWGWVKASEVTYSSGNPPDILDVTITPASAVSAGAQWRTANLCWQAPGLNSNPLCVGTYTIEFSTIPGFTTPPNQIVVLASPTSVVSITGNYTPITNPANISVNLSPAGALAAGAQWQIDNSPWYSSGNTLNTSSGNHTIQYKGIPGYTAPPSETVNLLPNQTTTVNRAYTAVGNIGNISGTLSPSASVSAGAQWRISGQAWNNSGSVLSNMPVGTYIIEYKPVIGWVTPPNRIITVQNGQTANANTFYDPDQQNTPINEKQTFGQNYPYGICAEPINMATGAYFLFDDDFNIPAFPEPLTFTRGYNSRNLNYNGPIGFGWTHSFDIFLSITADFWTVHFGDGHEVEYLPTGGGQSIPHYQGIYEELTQLQTGRYRLSYQTGAYYSFNSSGRLDSIVDRKGNAILFYYSASKLIAVNSNAAGTIQFYNNAGTGRIDSMFIQNTRKYKFTYSPQGDLLSVQDGAGAVTTYIYDNQHRITSIIDPLGNTIVNNLYDAQNRVTQQTDAYGNLYSFQYNTPVIGATTAFFPLGGNRIFYHDQDLRLIKEADELGFEKNKQYDDMNNLISTTDENGNSFSFSYDSRGNIVSIIDPKATITNITYNGNNDIFSITDALGNSTYMYYDAVGNMTTQALPGGTNLTFSYTNQLDAKGLLSSVVDALATTTNFNYTLSGGIPNPSKIIRPSGEMQFLYSDPFKRLTSISDYNNNLTTFTYDQQDHVLTETDALGKTLEYTYDLNGNMLTQKDKKGFITQFEYDLKNRLIKVTDPAGFFTSINYDALDRISSLTDPKGNIFTYTYDLKGQVTGLTHPLGTNLYTYDPSGNLIEETDPLGNITSYEYDALNHLIKTTDPLEKATRLVYDELGRVVQSSDALNQSTIYEYDNRGRLTKVTDPSGGFALYAYDPAGNLISITDPKGFTQNFTYDSEGRLTSRTDGAGNSYSYQYYDMGNLFSVIEPTGNTTYFYYDALYRLTGKSFSAFGSPDFSYSYDENDNLRNFSESTGNVGTTSIIYNNRNLPIVCTDPFGRTTTFTYDANGNRTKITYPGGNQVNYQYNGLNQMTSVQDWFNNTTSYQYNAGAQLTDITYGNGASAHYDYDPAARITGITHKNTGGVDIYKTILTLNDRGFRTSEQILAGLIPTAMPGDYTYSYNSDNQLLGDGVNSYTNNSSGFRSSETGPGGNTSYTWHASGTLASITKGPDVTSFVYDPLGNRIEKNKNGTKRQYLLDLIGEVSQVLREYDDAGNILNSYVYGIGLVSQISPNGDERYYHYDPMGNTIALTDQTGSLSDSYTYEPFGTVTNHVGTTDQPYLFMGQMGVQQETDGLLFVRARYLDVMNGRFLSRDPFPSLLTQTQTLNKLIYANNSPINYLDPMGLCSEKNHQSKQTNKYNAKAKAALLQEQAYWQEVVEWNNIYLDQLDKTYEIVEKAVDVIDYLIPGSKMGYVIADYSLKARNGEFILKNFITDYLKAGISPIASEISQVISKKSYLFASKKGFFDNRITQAYLKSDTDLYKLTRGTLGSQFIIKSKINLLSNISENLIEIIGM